MSIIDWSVFILYAFLCILIGRIFSQKTSMTINDYFAGGMKQPWWALGVSSTVSYCYTGFVALMIINVFTRGTSGNLAWLFVWAIWMPLVAIFWAKFWRRLGMITTAEIIEVRYSAKCASFYRSFYAVFMTLCFCVLFNAYVTGLFLKIASPLINASPWITAFIAAGVILSYCIASGIYGIIYSDLAKFFIFVAGNLILAFLIIHVIGGYDNIKARLIENNRHDFFNICFDYDLMKLAILIIPVLFAIDGFTAQRFIAAKNTHHAQYGLLFSTFLSLIVQVVPFIFLGIIAAATIDPQAVQTGDDIWGSLIRRYSVDGVMGFLVAGVFACYMAVVDTNVNWGASLIVNDVYKKYNRGTDSHYVFIAKISSAILLIISVVIALLFGSLGNLADFLVLILLMVILPLSLLRFFWWRMNIYGEMVITSVGIPLSGILWITGVLNKMIFWQFSLILLAGVMIGIIGSLLTRPESISVLKNFYLRCQPPGFWGYVKQSLSSGEKAALVTDFLADLLNAIVAIVLAVCTVFTLHMFFVNVRVAFNLLACCLVLFVLLIFRLKPWKAP